MFYCGKRHGRSLSSANAQASRLMYILRRDSAIPQNERILFQVVSAVVPCSIPPP